MRKPWEGDIKSQGGRLWSRSEIIATCNGTHTEQDQRADYIAERCNTPGFTEFLEAGKEIAGDAYRGGAFIAGPAGDQECCIWIDIEPDGYQVGGQAATPAKALRKLRRRMEREKRGANV